MTGEKFAWRRFDRHRGADRYRPQSSIGEQMCARGVGTLNTRTSKQDIGMHSIFYIIGVIVVVALVLSFLGIV
jgi:hypothetical protein